MGNFIIGVLVENEDGATYQNHTYDRFLKLQIADGQVLSIFDPPGLYGPISTGLNTGESYEMILITLPVPRSVHYFPTSPLHVEINLWQGTVVDTHWRVPEERSYKGVHEYLADREWMLLTTSRGDLLMNPKEISIPVSKGGVVQWENLRLDLCAVV